jgi:hypothetical protein
MKRQVSENTSTFRRFMVTPWAGRIGRFEPWKPFGAKAGKCAKISGEHCTNW